jgi:hypothetical protein
MFGGAPSRVSRTAERAAGFEAMLVARLRSASLRYPADALSMWPRSSPVDGGPI